LSTSILARAVKDARSGRSITTVDANALYSAEARKVLQPFPFVRLVIADASTHCRYSQQRGERFALVFVDHSHSYDDVSKVCRLLPAILVVKNGFALFHDFNDRRNNDPADPNYGVSIAVIDHLSAAEFEFFGIFGCSALYKRR
jgi:hypothetical protein